MAVSTNNLRDMARQILGDACSAPENWMELLGNIAPFYKYDVESAILIAAQRPDATACATMQMWNRRNLWIRKGSKAIYSRKTLAQTSPRTFCSSRSGSESWT